MHNHFLRATALIAVLLGFIAPAAHTQTVAFPDAPLQTASTISVKPNLLFVLDDSGSMMWSYTPDYVSSDDHWNVGGLEERMCYDSGDVDSNPAGNSTQRAERRDNNGLDLDSNIMGFNKICQPGDVPYMSPMFNSQYYNPNIRYKPGVNADGSSRASQTAAATTNWTSVRTDGYNVSNESMIGATTNNVNLTQFPERVWCSAKTDLASDSTRCFANTSTYAYPDAYNEYGRDALTNIKYRYGQPYYWKIDAFEHCTDATMTNCVVSATPTGSYTVPSTLRFCKYTGSKNTMQNANLSLTDCQAKHDVDKQYTYPRFLGRINPAETGRVPYARIAFPSNPIASQDIISVTVNGVNIMSSATLQGYTARTSLPTDLANSINSKIAAAGEQEFRACTGSGCSSPLGFNGSSNELIVYPTQAPASTAALMTADLNGVPIVVEGSPPSAGTKARTTLTIAAPTNTGTPVAVGISSMTIGGNSVISNLVISPAGTAAQIASSVASAINASTLYNATAAGNTVSIERVASGSLYNGETVNYTGSTRAATTSFTVGTLTGNGNKTVTVAVGNNAACTAGPALTWTRVVQTSTNATNMATLIRNQINNQSQGSITAASNNAVVTLTSNNGSNHNGWYVCFDTAAATGSSVSMPADGATRFNTNGVSSAAGLISGPPLSTGTNTGPIPTNATAFANGLVNRPVPYRTDQATWTRVNIASGFTYPKSGSRSDCSNTGYCTYAEEMTNFANWYTYYRTRMQMMKTAAGQSFSSLGDNFRVGFTAINDTDGGNFIEIKDFNATQKTAWYNKFYGMSNNGGTPLRAALSRAGRMFAGKDPFTTSGRYKDPVQYSCQQNFTILTTDGYWNENDETAIKRVDGTRVNNMDNAAGVSAPFYDGNPGSCPSGTASDCRGNTCHGSTTDQTKFSSCNTLADVALYYATTDLRQSGGSFDNCANQSYAAITANLCTNNVRESTRDPARFQHMTTFTLGLGVDGTLSFQDDYENSGSGDYSLVRAGTLKWPQVKNLHPTAVDDLWHAAVNGRGKYFSAKNPASLASGLNGALAEVNAQGGSGAAAATSNLEPTAGDNFAYVASYTTVKWTGNVEARTINVANGQVSTAPVWCVEDVLDSTSGNITCNGTLKTLVQAGTDTRTIHMFDGSVGSKLKPFTYSNLTTTQQGYFTGTGLSQYSSLSTEAQTAASGENLVNYLRGQYQYEDREANTIRPFRFREKTMADVIGSQPIYVKKPPFSYNDASYTAYVTANEGRAGAVYIGANDGMLHAFDAATGAERWAFVPTAMMPRMKNLADFNYGSSHKYFVDGEPQVGDVYSGGTWRTILVGGFSSGGVGYYALDITNPTAPQGLWEFPPASETDAGYSYSTPIITKLQNGTWVVILSSGYNNSGIGYTYVLNAVTGAIIRKISTGTGTAGSPSGLGRLTGFAPEMPFNNTTKYVYGGDLTGNLWRFDPAVDNSAKKIATLKTSSGAAQPITTKVEVASVDNQTLLYVGTGKYLETSDLSSNQTQTFYGIRDTFDTNGTITDPRAVLTRVQMTQVIGTDSVARSSTVTGGVLPNIVTGRGWYVDLPVSGERVNVDPQFVNGTLVVYSNVPSNTACEAGGSSYQNFFNYKTGSVLPGSSDFTGAIVVGFVVIKIGDSFVPLVTLSDSPNPVTGTAVPNDSGDTRYRGRRVSWKELNVD